MLTVFPCIPRISDNHRVNEERLRNLGDKHGNLARDLLGCC